MNVPFVPPQGALISRVRVDPIQNELIICFRVRLYYREIACIINFESRGISGRFKDPVTDIAHIVPGENVVIHRHFTTFAELQAMRRLWKSHITIEDWLSEVEALPKLSKEDKVRIRRVVRAEV